MGRTTRAVSAAIATASVIGLSGCAGMDSLIWGQDGATTISTTERLIEAAAQGDASGFVCNGADPELREPADWEGLSAEEPERFVPEYWEQFAALDPQWSINLSLPEDRVAPGVEYPGDVFYRDTDDGLCLVAVAWWTMEGQSER
ncbi:hypothetical protein [Microbacterium sp. OR16]|uniref:hypothetical protein n=1 Tax=Microbacterium sp. OR16 TaxID=3095345 RepID=UPI0039B671FB